MRVGVPRSPDLIQRLQWPMQQVRIHNPEFLLPLGEEGILVFLRTPSAGPCAVEQVSHSRSMTVVSSGIISTTKGVGAGPHLQAHSRWHCRWSIPGKSCHRDPPCLRFRGPGKEWIPGYYRSWGNPVSRAHLVRGEATCLIRLLVS